MIGLNLSANAKFKVYDIITNVRQNCEHAKISKENVTKLRRRQH